MNRVVVPNKILLAEVESLLREGHTVTLMTKGNSMLPFIRGDIDSVRLERFGEPAIGSAVLARIAPGQYVLHRLIAVDGQNATLHGDGNLRGDEHCRLSDICGVATGIVRPNGKVCGPFNDAAARWRKLPYTVRRYILGIYRRLI